MAVNRADQLVEFYVDALEDPLKPRWCGPSILQCIVTLRDKINLTELMYDHHIFWSTAIKFLTVKRTTEDIQSLDATWSYCRCDLGVNVIATRIHGQFRETRSRRARRDHRIAHVKLSDTMKHIIWPFAHLNSMTDSKKVARGTRPDYWPTSPMDLMPFGMLLQHLSVMDFSDVGLWEPVGPQATVDAIIGWANAFGPDPLRLVFPIMALVKPQIVPILTTTPSVPECILRIGGQICDKLSEHIANELDRKSPILDDICQDLSIIAIFLDLFSRRLGPFDLQRFSEGREVLLFRFADRVVRLTATPPMLAAGRTEKLTAIHHILPIFASHIYMSHKDVSSIPRSEITPLVSERIDSVGGMASGMTAAEFAVTVMSTVKNDQVCFALDCTQSMQTVGKRFSRCGGCHLISYCGEECQKRAWKSMPYAHRDICAIVGRVYKAAPGMVAVRNFVGFDEEMKKAGIENSSVWEAGQCLSLLMLVMRTDDESSAKMKSSATAANVNLLQMMRDMNIMP